MQGAKVGGGLRAPARPSPAPRRFRHDPRPASTQPSPPPVRALPCPCANRPPPAAPRHDEPRDEGEAAARVPQPGRLPQHGHGRGERPRSWQGCVAQAVWGGGRVAGVGQMLLLRAHGHPAAAGRGRQQHQNAPLPSLQNYFLWIILGISFLAVLSWLTGAI